MFFNEYCLANAKPASYNPRRLDEDARAKLVESLQTVGILKPIIATVTGTLLAGHQRTSAMASIGITHAPAFVLPEMPMQDEVRFNQLHNGCDLEVSDGFLKVEGEINEAWQVVQPSAIKVIRRPTNATMFNEICRLLAKYGEFGSAVVTESGEIIVHALYAYCHKLLAMPLRVVKVPDAQRERIIGYFDQTYGTYSYAHLPKNTYIQSLAQVFRLRDESMTTGKSLTYERQVIGKVTKAQRILDFGAGQKDYVKKLKREGYDIHGVEFFLRKGGTKIIDTKAVHRDIEILCRSLETRGLYDVVICDSVLNSVNSLQAERDVVRSIAALCRKGGTVIFSGRRTERVERVADQAFNGDKNQCRRRFEFLDADGFTGLFRAGEWYYQKFHSREQVEQLIADHIGTGIFTPGTTEWQAVATKTANVEGYSDSLANEFDLPWPKGHRVGRADQILSSWRAALAQEPNA